MDMNLSSIWVNGCGFISGYLNSREMGHNDLIFRNCDW